MKALLRLYPPAWRARYGEELAALVENERLSLRLVVDLVAGALDARFNSRLPPGADAGGTHQGAATMRKMIVHCEPLHLTMAEQWKSAGLMIGAAVVLAGIATGLKAWFGDPPLVEAFMTSTFPLAVLIGTSGTYFKPYSRTARGLIIGGLAGVVFLISLTASLIGSVI